MTSSGLGLSESAGSQGQFPQWPAGDQHTGSLVCVCVSRLIGWSAEEHLPAEPHCLFRGADGEADGTRVLEDLMVVSALIGKHVLEINDQIQSLTYVKCSLYFFSCSSKTLKKKKKSLLNEYL